jgi:hypothetical protein
MVADSGIGESAVAKRNRRSRHKPARRKKARGEAKVNANAKPNPNATTTLFRDDFIHDFTVAGAPGRLATREFAR